MAKMPVRYCVVDAFTDAAFKGNPAVVCFLEKERDEEWLQAVACEFNISETCFLTRLAESPDVPRFRLRWFTPVAEVKLCGHATLAAAHFLFVYGLVSSDVIEFSTLSGILTAKRVPETKASNLQNGGAPIGNAVAEVEPRFDEIQKCAGRGIIITGPAPPGSRFDFYSRFFCPKLGVNEASPRSGVINLHLDEKNQ